MAHLQHSSIRFGLRQSLKLFPFNSEYDTFLATGVASTSEEAKEGEMCSGDGGNLVPLLGPPIGSLFLIAEFYWR